MNQPSVTSVLMRLSYELHGLADATDEFHHLAFGDDAPSKLDDANFVRATQSIDLTQQILSNLSQFVECLAMAAPETWKLDIMPALSLVTLSDLRNRLTDAPAAAEDMVEEEEDIFF